MSGTKKTPEVNQALNFMGVDEVNGGLFIAVLDNFIKGKMKFPLFGSGSKCATFSSVLTCFGFSPRALTRSAPIHFANLRAFLSKATVHIAPVEIKTA